VRKKQREINMTKEMRKLEIKKKTYKDKNGVNSGLLIYLKFLQIVTSLHTKPCKEALKCSL
jgi:hypothetical protein